MNHYSKLLLLMVSIIITRGIEPRELQATFQSIGFDPILFQFPSFRGEENEVEFGFNEEGITETEVIKFDYWDQGPTLPALGDSNGWASPQYYSTIQALIILDSIWVLARNSDGMEVYSYDQITQSWRTHATLSDLADSNKWGSDPKYYSTIQVVELYDDLWLLARSADGLEVYYYNIVKDTWTPKQGSPNFSDANGWGSVEYYSTIQAFNFSSNIWVFARGPAGEEIHQYSPDNDNWNALPTLAVLSDAENWGNDPKYYSTIKTVKLANGFWLLARNMTGIIVYQFDPTAVQWTEKQTLPELSDVNGWGAREYYSTIRVAAFQSTIWVFARADTGVHVYQYDPDTDLWTIKNTLTQLSDDNYWNNQNYSSTIQIVPLNTSIALLARGPNGLEYYEYAPADDSWDSKLTLKTLSDENGWDNQTYSSTIKGINYMDTLNVLARGPSGMDVYDYV